MRPIYRKISVHIWNEPRFRRLGVDEKIAAIHAIVHGNTPAGLERYTGPRFRVPSGVPRRRPDLYSATWRSLRLRLLKERGTTCAYCGADCAEDPTLDHVRPVSQGGSFYEESNLVVSCRPCNSRKGGKEGWHTNVAEHPLVGKWASAPRP